MKKILLLIVACLFIFVSCENQPTRQEKLHNKLQKMEYTTIIKDSCEYLMYKYSAGHNGFGFMSHKGNCKFCVERQRKLIREIIKEELR